MRPHKSFSVVPQLPDSLEPLRELAGNLRFSWDPATVDLFRMLDRDLWETCGKNPVLFLGRISQKRLEDCAHDDAIHANLQRVWKVYSKYLASDQSWWAKEQKDGNGFRIAYFSLEFGLAACMPLYSGGLGVLAGDHLKSASDLGLPLVGVGLLYQRGYFRQYLSPDGWQQESYPTNDFHNLPMSPVRSEGGEEVVIQLPLDGHTLDVKVWRVEVGRVPLILLDTNLLSNTPDHRHITSDLYGGDAETRLRQEFVVGVGGVRARAAIGMEPDICHMNEGHSAFLALERIRVFMERDGLSFEEARLASASATLFTTHTPVRAAIDLFQAEQMDGLFAEWRAVFGISNEELMDLGRETPGEKDTSFNMAIFALRNADASNGVAKLHGRVSRKMWSHLWPGVPVDEVPITSITNGVHTQTWISREIRELLDRYLGPRWARDPSDSTIWEGIERIPAEQLWRTHEGQRQRLVSYLRRRMRARLRAQNATAPEIASVQDILDGGALTIGFARRFAPYKRGNLFMRDRERIISILSDAKRPVQFIIAGKAHPRDDAGKKLIQEIVHFSRQEGLRSRIVFVENYDMDVAAHLVHGVDVWLNTPRRPLEASGTSGMKASANGAINLSVLDGWWDEAAAEGNGWSIGKGEVYEDEQMQDEIESNALYDLLENEIIPLFYDRGRDGLPRGWIRMMKEAMSGITPVFCTARMVAEYAERAYVPAAARSARLHADGFRGVRDLAAWRQNALAAWEGVQIREIESPDAMERRVGEKVPVRALVSLGGLAPEDVTVQLYHGDVDLEGSLTDAVALPMTQAEEGPDGARWFSGRVPCSRTGHRGFAVRVLPGHPDLATSFVSGLIRWNDENENEDVPAEETVTA